MTTIGLVHPGEMGSMVGAAARAGGARVVWASGGRSRDTAERATRAGLEDVRTLGALVAASDVVLSVCPPHAALDVAREVASHRFDGLYVDANAVSPRTAREIGSIVEARGAAFVDGALIGPPPISRGTTRLYLSGDEATRVAAFFEQSALEAVALDASPGAASALKMAYAAWTKGTSALLLSIRALAIAEGVDDALVAEWSRSHPDLAKRSESARGSARKAWRFVGEMEEIAAALDEAGLPGDFCEAAAEVYRRLAAYKDGQAPPALAEIASTLLGRFPGEERRAS